MKLYICGPVSMGGTLTDEQVEQNLQRFRDAEKQLVAAGYEVESPERILKHEGICALLPLTGERTWSWWLRRTLIQMLLCDAIATLPGYAESAGYQLERYTAEALGMEIAPLHHWLARL